MPHGLIPSPSGLILSIDQGTTNTKAALIGPDATPVFRTSIPVTLLQPQPGFVEQDPNQLWSSVRDAMEQCAAHALSLGQPVAAIAISNQRETAVAWTGQTGAPGQPPIALGNAVSWQCRRSAPLCERLTPHHALIQQRSGLPVDPLLTAGKWSWLLENQPPTAEPINLGTVDSWLLACLTNSGIHATDLTNASRTGLLDLATLTWSPELCTLFNIPLASLPQLRPSAFNFGLCTSIPALAGVPILSVIGDSHAALAGHGSYTPGTVKATYGTGSSLMTLTPPSPAHPTLARTIAWALADQVQYALEGNIAMAGAAPQWVGEFLALPNPAADAAALAASVPSSEGLYFVPAMVGLGAPHWDTAARGSITRLERSHRAPHLARAAVEAIAFQVADVFFALESAAGTPLPVLRADGGAARNDTLMQFQADLLGRPVLRSINDDLSLLGAAALAGITLGWWPSLKAFAQHTGETRTFTPAISPTQRATLLEGWRTALTTARTTARSQASS